jgi:hypothetical protein
MTTGSFWPISRDRDEVVLPYAPTRAASVARELLQGFQGVLLTDGDVAYKKDVEQANTVVHAPCCLHTRRQFLAAKGVEPELTGTVLELIRQLDAHEARLNNKLLELRALGCRPIVEEFFGWLKQTLCEHVLLPPKPFTAAAQGALSRQRGLRVFLERPELA